MSATIEVRIAGGNDGPLLSELGARAFAEAYPTTDPDDLALHIAHEYSLEAVGAELAAPGSRFFIAAVDGEPVGYALVREGDAHEDVPGDKPVELNRIYVLQEWVGKGVGDALMERCLAEVGAGGCDTMWLGTWDQNARAIRFYERWGFETVGTQTFRLGNDLQSDIVMARPV